MPSEDEEPALAIQGTGLLYQENEHYNLVDALPYIDTQLGAAEVAQQVKALIDEEMRLFEPRDYLASLPAPELPHLQSELISQELARQENGVPMTQGIDPSRYEVEAPEGATDHVPWKAASDALRMQLEYSRLKLTNLELLERWGQKAWVAHSSILRASERLQANDTTSQKTAREEVNKKRKLDQISCGNEIRKLQHELEQYMQDNIEVEQGLRKQEAEVMRLKENCIERGIDLSDDPSLCAVLGIAVASKEEIAEAEAKAADDANKADHAKADAERAAVKEKLDQLLGHKKKAEAQTTGSASKKPKK
eukprot:gnl/TRDRNA2_/TRDRNA2_180932_c0_seq1.p1 gnl/TRDRNA2_/TRDRNA2_180932_c0~~gnl/TRDRNA2_/TRDRNA2_180932_c0_seq1.p1  ORF type:complete len:323 (+),score=100.49 gnl/TRDRNA2_/TRDRNA2_180932_c0_seq1:47-970(+)